MADTLIAYYSWSGRSAALSRKLHRSLPGSELYHIEAKRKYSRHFIFCAKQAFMEKRRNERPDIRVHLTGKQMLKYDRVILIYPIWCGTCPMAVRTFLESIRTDRLDLFPVSLSMTSTAAKSLSDIRESAPKAAIAEGLSLKGRKSDSAESVEAVMTYLGLRQSEQQQKNNQ